MKAEIKHDGHAIKRYQTVSATSQDVIKSSGRRSKQSTAVQEGNKNQAITEWKSQKHRSCMHASVVEEISASASTSRWTHHAVV